VSGRSGKPSGLAISEPGISCAPARKAVRDWYAAEVKSSEGSCVEGDQNGRWDVEAMCACGASGTVAFSIGLKGWNFGSLGSPGGGGG